MNGTVIYTPQTTSARTNGISTFLATNWFKIAFLCVFAYCLHSKDANIQFSMGGKAYVPPNTLYTSQEVATPALMSYGTSSQSPKKSTPSTSNTTESVAPIGPKQPVVSVPIVTETHNSPLAQHTENEGLFLDPNQVFGEAVAASPKASKKKKDCQAYIKRFKATAISEMKKYGIPASITLAQGILESNVGISRLANDNNNHFGLKCFSKSCGKGHCSNYHDDGHKDFFRKFDTAWESYRAHSLLLTGSRYRHLNKLKRTDYKSWAKGLQKAGYATNSRYAANLIQLIESLNLHKYDV